MRVPDTPTGNRWRQWKRIRRFLGRYGDFDDQIAWVVLIVLLLALAGPETLATGLWAVLGWMM